MTRSEKEAQAAGGKDQPATAPAASDTVGETKQSVKGVNSMLCIFFVLVNCTA